VLTNIGKGLEKDYRLTNNINVERQSIKRYKSILS